MYVPGQIDLALTGKEVQEIFYVEKYVGMALSSPAGVALRAKVDTPSIWAQWAGPDGICAHAGWLRNWRRSRFYAPRADGHSEDRVDNIAGAIFTSAVWGFGLEGWVTSGSGHNSMISDGIWKGKNFSLKCICELQGIHAPNSARTWMWDDILYRGCGVLIPVEYGYLDRWLESL